MINVWCLWQTSVCSLACSHSSLGWDLISQARSDEFSSWVNISVRMVMLIGAGCWYSKCVACCSPQPALPESRRERQEGHQPREDHLLEILDPLTKNQWISSSFCLEIAPEIYDILQYFYGVPNGRKAPELLLGKPTAWTPKQMLIGAIPRKEPKV